MQGGGRQGGFTLIEVMIVVVIVAGLLLVALPGYRDAMQKARRSDAKASLQEAATRQEKFMSGRSTYTTNVENLGYADPFITPEEHYRIVVDAPTGDCPIDTCYSLTATPRPDSPQSDDDNCTSFTLTSNGAKTALGKLGTDCW